MSRKVPEVIFTAIPNNGKLLFSNPEHLSFYCAEHEGEPLMVHLEPIADVSSKMKMYAYYHVNVLNCAVIGYTAAGWEGVDIVKADYLLRAEFAKSFVKDGKGNYIPYVIDKRNMTKARLLKFIQDCIFFIENELDVTVPSSEEYKVKKITGKHFQEVKANR